MIKNPDKLIEELRNAIYETIEHGFKANQVVIEVSEERSAISGLTSMPLPEMKSETSDIGKDILWAFRL
jgi:hypothetical protein